MTPPRPTRASELELLRRYHADGDFDARSRAIESGMSLVHHVVGRFRVRAEVRDELVQAGSLGLIKAVDRFDPARQLRFTSFAVPCIAGEIMRYLRDHDDGLRLPRDVQERLAQIRDVRDRLMRMRQREPTVPEIAEAMDVDPALVLEAMASSHDASPLSLDAPVAADDDGTALLGERIGSEDGGYARSDATTVARLAVRYLPERDRELVRLRFDEDLTQQEIADRMGISQMHVSRLLRASLERMRGALETAA